MSAIEMRNVTKTFGDATALDGLSVAVEEGEVYGFLGPNGAGKSTAINVLLGLARPTDGSASVFGLDTQTRSKSIRFRTGSLLEGHGVYERLTAREHVERAVAAKGAGDDPTAILERVGIAEAADRRAGGLSKGLRQRLALGVALVGEPDLLLLDEPATGLDPSGIRDVREIVREENRRGATVVFSSHLIEQVEAVCDRIGILRDGRLVIEGAVSDLRSELDATTLTVAVDSAPDWLLSEIRDIDGVVEVTAGAKQIRVVARGGGAKFKALVSIDSAAVGFDDFRTTDPSLADVFEHATADRDAGGESRSARAEGDV